jgi:hypothetical protein
MSEHYEQMYSGFEKGEKPLLTLKKTKNEYGIEMNRVRYGGNTRGESRRPGSEDAGEPVRIKLGIRDYDSSQSSMEIELLPKMMT